MWLSDRYQRRRFHRNPMLGRVRGLQVCHHGKQSPRPSAKVLSTAESRRLGIEDRGGAQISGLSDFWHESPRKSEEPSYTATRFTVYHCGECGLNIEADYWPSRCTKGHVNRRPE